MKLLVKILGTIVLLGLLYIAGLYFIILNHTQITSASINSYQFKELHIIYISSFVTGLALIVALLKDEIRSFYIRPEIQIKPKTSNFIIEKPKDTNTGSNDIQCEYYYVILNITNIGKVHIDACSISLNSLQYKSINGSLIDIDIESLEEIKWISKSVISIPIHSNGGKVEANVIQIKLNDAGTPGGAQSQSAKLFISGIEATKGHSAQNGSQWFASFMIYIDKRKPIEYKLEISWDGVWQNRLTEMREHCKIKEIRS